MDATAQNVPLFAFATAMEFSKVFPEAASVYEGSDVPKNSLISLKWKSSNAYACVLGVGILDFSVSLSFILSDLRQSNKMPSVVVNMGICGAFPNRGLSLLDVVRVQNDGVGDLGFEGPDGSFNKWEKTYGENKTSIRLFQDFDFVCSLKTVRGITVNCCTGTQATSADRVRQFDCDVESMEGAACFAVCEKFGVPAVQIRAVSNMATTRDKSKWKVDEALKKLATLFA